MGALIICLLTYERTDYAVKTLASALENIRTRLPIHVHIADDGSPVLHRDTLVDYARSVPAVQGISISNSERGGYGRNVNLASQITHMLGGEYILMLEDDWELVRALDIDALISDMQACARLACIRLGYLSHTQPLLAEILTVGSRNSKYLLLDPVSPEPHVFAGHPRLETVVYQRLVGEWPEGLTPGETEFSVAHKLAARTGVVWPMDLIHSYGDLFAHIGTRRSY